MKFVNSAKAYRADTLILGGDITGKILVPIIEKPGGYEATFLGTTHVLQSKDLAEFEKSVASQGSYTYMTNDKEMIELQTNPNKRNELFKKLMIERLLNWISIIKERLYPAGVIVYISGGNDDILEVEDVLRGGAPYVIDPEGSVVELDGGIPMITLGYSNFTPWKCPRETSEEELGQRIDVMASKLSEPHKSIFNLHVPPFDSGIDLAPKLDENLVPILGGTGTPEMIPVGSTAVKKAIQQYQPLLALHGHIHEGRGFTKIGSTLCINPGSDYSEGILRGVMAEISHKGIKQYVLTEG